MRGNPTLLLISFVAVIATSCAANKTSASLQDFGIAQKTETQLAQVKRKIITNVHISLEVENTDSANLALTSIATAYGGYVSEVGDNRSLIRVKSELLDKAMSLIGEVGTIKNKTASGVDVTEEYFDYEIRLENAEKTRSRYLELLKIAKTVDEILKIEKELERLNETIDLIKGRMNRLSHLSEYATIHITFTERVKPGLVGYAFVGLYKSVGWLFVRK